MSGRRPEAAHSAVQLVVAKLRLYGSFVRQCILFTLSHASTEREAGSPVPELAYERLQRVAWCSIEPPCVCAPS
ncbi:hypothetical protein OH77DRAFT_1428771 [Trametes cingulata]|nr:hypothetical protein OH77DRAFT_1428771 [Trametes cingulata]